MEKYFKITHTFITTVVLLFAVSILHPVSAQCTSNAYLKSNNNHTTIEYDNMVGSSHANFVRAADGKVYAWGERMGSNGNDDITLREVNSTNYSGLTGTILKFAIGSYTENRESQAALLTTDGLFVWGNPGSMISSDIKNNNTFGRVAIGTYNVNGGNTKADGLPDGVGPNDVKMLFGSRAGLAIVTNNGQGWVLANSYSDAYGDGASPSNATNNRVWHRVSTGANTPLTDIVAIRGAAKHVFMALTTNGNIYTWGKSTYLGDGTGLTNRYYATQMALPSFAGGTFTDVDGTQKPHRVKMIGMTSQSIDNDWRSYYVLGTDGILYGMGFNSWNMLTGNPSGNNETLTQWKRTVISNQVINGITYTLNDNIAWISPNEHSEGYGGINVLTKEGKLWAWGFNQYFGDPPSQQRSEPHCMPGRTSGAYDVNRLNATDIVVAVESAGHATFTFKQCSTKIGHVGCRKSNNKGDGNTGNSTDQTYDYAHTGDVELCGTACDSDLEVTKWIHKINGGSIINLSNSTVNVGDEVEFEVMVKNNGPTDMTAVKVNDLIPSGYAYVSHSTLDGTYNSTIGIWDIGTVQNGHTKRVYIKATVNATGNHTNTATIDSYDGTDTNLGNNEASASVSITVSCTNPTSVSISPASQTVTPNGTPTDLTATITGATSYQWYSSATAGTSGGTLIPGATLATYTPPTSASGTTYYYVVATNSCGSTTADTSVSVTVSCTNPTNVSISPASQNVAQNGTPTNLTASGTGATSYQWYSSATAGTSGGTLISGATSVTYTPPTTAIGTTYYYAIATNSCGSTTADASVSVRVIAPYCLDNTVSSPILTNATITETSVDLNMLLAGPIPIGMTAQWFTSATPLATNALSSTKITATSTATNYYVYYSYFNGATYCYGHSSKVTVISNNCPTSTFNLEALPHNTAPTGSSLVWYTTKTHDTGTKVTDPTAVGSGTYWPFFYDNVNNCFSPEGSPVVVSIKICNKEVIINCPDTTYNLNNISVSTAPAGSILQWHTVNTGFVQSGSGQTLVSNPATVPAGTYYPVFFNSNNGGCYSPVGTAVVVKNNCTKEVINTCPETSYNLTLLTVTPSAPSGSTLQWHTVNTGFVQSGAGQTLVSNPAAVPAGTYYPVFYDSVNGCYSPAGTSVHVTIQPCGGCYKPGILDAGNTYPTNHGITAMGRAGENNSNWPMVRESAWTVLEAKTKGFVINRIKTTAEVNALPEPVEGMTVYDVEADCLKIYTSKDNGLTFGWYCFTAPACPD